jgi:orotate phosphoribosyltransferase-like protein
MYPNDRAVYAQSPPKRNHFLPNRSDTRPKTGVKIMRVVANEAKMIPSHTPDAPICWAYTGMSGAMMPTPIIVVAIAMKMTIFDIATVLGLKTAGISILSSTSNPGVLILALYHYRSNLLSLFLF